MKIIIMLTAIFLVGCQSEQSGGDNPSSGGSSSETISESTSSSSSSGGSDPAPLWCTREDLAAAATRLAEALETADFSLLTSDEAVTYIENWKPSGQNQGVWRNPVEIEFQRDFLDEDTCETFSEIIVTAGTPLVLGVRMTLTGQDVSEVSALVSDSDDWLFNAEKYARVSSAEDWGVIAEEDRDTRETLIAAGDAYLNLFSDKSVVVPWGTPCTRLEGGAATTGNTCDVGVPSGINFTEKHWIVDRALGTATVMTLFAERLPDSHMFRSLKGRIRYVHTITICEGGC